MLRDAVNEIRLHPGRFVATLLAIAISVGFIVAISTAVNTESEAMARSNSLPLSNADIVVAGYFEDPHVLELIESVDGVETVASGATSMTMLTVGDASVFANLIPTPPEPFRWAELTQGHWPAMIDEIAMSADALTKLGVEVGDVVESYGRELTVVGETADARSLYSVTVYSSVEYFAEIYEAPVVVDDAGDPITIDLTPYVVQLDGTVPIDETMIAVENVLPASPEDEISVMAGSDARQEALNAITGDVDVFKYLLYGFAGIALVVGMIIISNTFTILVTQRRRQIGLLRAVGASTGQVRGRLITEALLIGLIGSLIGVALGLAVAAVAAVLTGSMFWGLTINVGEVAVAVGVGVLATFLSVLGPSLTATRVKPIEALQVVPTAAEAKQAGVVRLIVCGVFLVAGIGLIAYSRANPEWALLWAILAGALISVAVLGSAPLYVAALLRGFGKLFGWTGTTTRLAAENAARNPRRAAATTVALMLAVGLVVTLQVGVATIRTTGMAAIDEQFPQDLTAVAPEVLPAEFIDSVRETDGVAQLVEISSKPIDVGIWEPLQARNINAARAELGLPDRLDAGDGDLLVSDYQAAELPAEVTVDGVSGPVTLTVKKSGAIGWGLAAVSEATFQELRGEPVVQELWVKLTDRTEPHVLNQVVTALEQGPDNLYIDGGAVLAGIMEQVLDVILIVLTALLGVAVVIALVGVSNTLGLSVIERQRESALLRALGMQRGGLRLMLLAEAMLLAVVGTGIGILAGAFFGWLGVTSAFLMMSAEVDLVVHFGIDVPLTLLLIVVCVAAAALASVLPGRRAANATPVEALAAE